MKAKKRRKMPFTLRLKIKISKVFRRINGAIYRFRYDMLKYPPEYKRKHVTSIKHVMDIIGNTRIRSRNPNPQIIVVNDETIRINTDRMRRFCTDYKENGKIVCKQCGLEASIFAVEKPRKYDKSHWSLNLYGIVNGKNILFTLDHIIPKSRGGSKKSLTNHETLCKICNETKADTIIPHKQGKRAEKQVKKNKVVPNEEISQCTENCCLESN